MLCKASRLPLIIGWRTLAVLFAISSSIKYIYVSTCGAQLDLTKRELLQPSLPAAL